MRKLGIHLCFTNVVKTFDDSVQDASHATTIQDDLFGFSSTRQEDRPLIVQVRNLVLSLLKSRDWTGPERGNTDHICVHCLIVLERGGLGDRGCKLTAYRGLYLLLLVPLAPFCTFSIEKILCNATKFLPI